MEREKSRAMIMMAIDRRKEERKWVMQRLLSDVGKHLGNYRKIFGKHLEIILGILQKTPVGIFQ